MSEHQGADTRFSSSTSRAGFGLARAPVLRDQGAGLSGLLQCTLTSFHGTEAGAWPSRSLPRVSREGTPVPVEVEVFSEAWWGKDPPLQGSGGFVCVSALRPVRDSAVLSRPSSA